MIIRNFYHFLCGFIIQFFFLLTKVSRVESCVSVEMSSSDNIVRSQFDHVFDMTATQQEVFDLIEPTLFSLLEVLIPVLLYYYYYYFTIKTKQNNQSHWFCFSNSQGYNCTIFAYGQTGMRNSKSVVFSQCFFFFYLWLLCVCFVI